MSRSLPWPGLLTGLLVLGGGCQNVDRFPTADPIAPGEAAARELEELPGGETPASFRVLAAVPPTVQPCACTLQAPLRPGDSTPAGPAASIGPAECSPAVRHPSECVRMERPTPTPLVVVPATRSVFAHAPDYRWLVGCLQYENHNRWSVHYCDDANDRYEGVLELVNPGPMIGFCHGQMVRVEGELVDPAPFEIKPAYRVFSLQVLRR